MDKTWNHGAVRRFFERFIRDVDNHHIIERVSYRVGEDQAHVVHAYLLQGPFDPRWDPDLSHRAKRSIRAATWAFVTHEEWIGETAITYFNDDPETDKVKAREYFDGFAHLMGY